MKIGICARTWGEKGGIGVYSRNLLEAMLSIDSGNEFVLFYKNKSRIGQFNRYQNVREMYVPAYGLFIWDQGALPYYAAKERVVVLW